MKRRRSMRTSQKSRIRVQSVFVLFLMMLAVVVTVGIRAKYRQNVEMNENIQFQAELAESVTLTEHAVGRKADGTYFFTDATAENGENSYQVMPGVDIPKDPTFTITNKSSIDAYLYVEVLEQVDSAAGFVKGNIPSTVEYTLTEQWEQLAVDGQNGGSVYVYKGTLPTSGDIQILKNNLLTVSQEYSEDTDEFRLVFWGYMAQKIDKQSVEEVYKKVFLP